MGKDPDKLRSEIVEKMDQLKSAITGSVDRVRRSDVQNPLGLFFGMAAVGFLIGSLIPITPIEDEQLVPIVGQMRERARNRVQNTIEAARDAAVSSISEAMRGTSA